MPRRLLAFFAPLVVAVLYFASTASAVAPVLSVPGDITTEATGASTPVSYSVTATDTEDPVVTPTCDYGISGDSFPVGTTTVSCSVTDSESLTDSGSFTVTVQDTTLPTVTAPANVTTAATSPSGRNVTYPNATATDNVAVTVGPNCGPPSSGSLFPIGLTTVTCSAGDAAGNTGTDTFDVTVTPYVDTEDPVVTAPADVTTSATTPTGANVTYPNATATDNVGVTDGPTCGPPSGSFFSTAGSPHLVTCTAKDAAGNTGTDTFNVSVQDAGTPIVTPPPSLTVEANSSTGSTVTYGAPSAIDPPSNLPVVATCGPPASGSTFPLGETVVPCSASDGAGHTGSASFTVTVQDTTPPVLTVPGQLIIASIDPVSSSAPLIASWLSFVTAVDLVDGPVAVEKSVPGSFPIGFTAVTFSATDGAGNTVTKITGISVVTVPTTGSVPPTSTTVPTSVQPDASPDNVRSLKAKPGNRTILLTWTLPANTDFDHVEIARSPGKGGAAESVVYKGAKTSYLDTSVVNGVQYRYLLVAVDAGGNRSVGVAVVAVAKLQLLLAPGDGARVTRPPLLRWKKVKNAAYYNVQLYRNQRKVNSRWPAGTSLRLTASWAYDGHRFRLGRGCYDWWVWPGLGKKADARYGEALGHSTFCVKSKPKAA